VATADITETNRENSIRFSYRRSAWSENF